MKKLISIFIVLLMSIFIYLDIFPILSALVLVISALYFLLQFKYTKILTFLNNLIE